MQHLNRLFISILHLLSNSCSIFLNCYKNLHNSGGIAEAFYGMPPELQQETLKRLPEDLRAAYELFRQNLKRKM